MKMIWMLTVAMLTTLLLFDDADAKNLTVKAGKTSYLFPFGKYNTVTCNAVNRPKYTLTQPENGTLKVVYDYAVGKHGPCKGRKVRVNWLVYIPNRGFRGIDRGAISYEDSITGDLMMRGSRHESVTINVK